MALLLPALCAHEALPHYTHQTHAGFSPSKGRYDPQTQSSPDTALKGLHSLDRFPLIQSKAPLAPGRAAAFFQEGWLKAAAVV